MYSNCRSIIGAFFLIICLICGLAGCSVGKSVDSKSDSPANTSIKQETGVPPVAPSPTTETKVVQKPPQVPAQLLFLRVDPGRSSTDPSEHSRDIWVMDSNGSNPVNLTRGSENVLSADWSPDKSAIVFDSVDSYLLGYPVCHISTMNADGSNIKRISPGASSRHFPAWAPDGIKIANSKYFAAACMRVVPCKYFQLFSFNKEGAEDGPVVFSTDNGNQLLPRWFPDSKRVAFLNFGTGYYEIYSGDLVTGDTIKFNVQNNTSYMPWFSLSPDGTRIVYSHDLSRDGMHTGRELYLFDINTGVELQLTQNDYADDNPCFSPDGKQVLFTSFGSTEETSGMFIMDIDGKNVKKIPSKYGDMPMKWK
jgi:Tol biopolymer transport system component